MQKQLKQISGSRLFRVGALSLVLYALVGFLLLPYLVERYVPDYVDETLQRQASIGHVRINPFLLRVEISDFSLQESDKRPIAAFRQLLIDFELSSLFRWAWTFADIRLEGLDLLIDNGPNHRLNLVELADSFPPGEAPSADDDNRPARLLLMQIALVDSAFTYSDRSGKTPASITLKPVNLELKNLSTLPERNGPHALSADLPEGGKLNVEGEVTLHPLAATGTLGIQGFKPASIWNFLRDSIRLAEPQGVIDLQLGYRFSHAKGKTRFSAQGLQLHAAGLDVREPAAQEPLLALETLDVKDGQFDLDTRALSLPRLELRNGRVGVALAADGTVNWQNLTVAESAPASPAASPKPPEAAAPWRIQLGATQLDNIAVQVTDHNRPTPLALDVGQVGASLKADINIGDTTTVTANDIALKLAKLALTPIEESEPLATLAEFQLDGGRVDTGNREVGISQVTLRGGNTRIERDAQGTTRLFAALSGAKDTGAEVTATAAAEQSAWRFKLDALQLEAFHVDYAHLSLQPALAYTLEDITATLKNLSNDVQTPVSFEAALRVAQGGALTANGSFAPDGSSADVKLKLDHIALDPLHSLLAQHAALVLKNGAASAETDLEYRLEPAGPLLRAKGTAHVTDLLINETAGGDRFLSWKSLAADGIDFASRPGRLNIKDVSLVAPGAKVHIFEDRSVNLGKVFTTGATASSPTPPKQPAQPPERADAAEQAFPVKVARVRVEKGIVDYSDESLVLPFAAKIRDFHGTVSGITSDPASRAKLALEGRVEEYGQAKVSGALSPFAPARFTDIRTEFRNIDMPPLSPYSATFAGRKIASGKLSLDLEYKIDDSALAGDNKILLEKFTLGEPVDSPDALDLPLDLAVALLTDSQGRIDVAVPVTGDLDNPKFSLGGVIGQAVMRMLTKLITAPFSALGGLLGGSGELSNAIAFDPGSVQIQPPQQEKLVNVGKALRDRPQLKVIVGGRYDPERDGVALRTQRVQRELATELDIELAPDEAPAPAAFEFAQTQRALEKLLEVRAGDNAIDAFQSQFEQQSGQAVERVNPVLALIGQESPDHAFYAALFDRLVELHPLAEADLKALAQRRAELVAQALVTDAGVDKQRVDIGSVETAKGARDNQVETTLALDVQTAKK